MSVVALNKTFNRFGQTILNQNKNIRSYSTVSSFAIQYNNNYNSFYHNYNNNNNNNNRFNLINNNNNKNYFSTEAILQINHVPEKVRNVAIIAHVDHGKTTLVDKLLKSSDEDKIEESAGGNNSDATDLGQSGEGERLMDSMSLEQERGITIMSKYTRVEWKDHILNIVDTPGHADFGGEVERILSMVDGVVLVIDATEGPMSQTKFVLSKAIEHGLAPMVILNKADRDTARLANGEVENEVFDLFVNLDANDDQLEYPTMYASAKEGWAVHKVDDVSNEEVKKASGMSLLLDQIVDLVPAPATTDNIKEPFKFEVNSRQSDAFVGRLTMGKVHSGEINIGDNLKVLKRDGTPVLEGTQKVMKLFCQKGMDKIEINKGSAGDIIWIGGIDGGVSDTICSPDVEEALPTTMIDPPVISMTFGINDSPIAGKEGKYVTSAQLIARLHKEVENNVTLQLKASAGPDSLEVMGRGELQLGILVETLRREDFEFCVSPPKVLTIIDEKTGDTMEPVEEVVIDIESDYAGMVIEKLTLRKGNLKEFKDFHGGKQRLIFEVPSRGMMGFISQMKMDTKGTAVINSTFLRYEKAVGKIDGLFTGKLISMETGVCSSYALNLVEKSGTLFVEPQTKVYPGMIIGENSRPADLDVNPCKEKKLTNIRSVLADEAVRLSPVRQFSVEEYISYMSEDEKLEVTPSSLRLRKAILDQKERQRITRQRKNARAGKN